MKKIFFLLANGKGSRFKNDFKNQPKPLIEYKGKPLIEWSLETLKKITPDKWREVIVISKYDSVREFIYKKYNLRVFDPGSTNSPAETLEKSKSLWEKHQLLYTLDCDLYFEAERLNKKNPLTLYTVYSNSKNFSYIKLDNNGFVANIEEKKVISNQAIVGFYVFDTNQISKFFKSLNYKNLSLDREVFLSDIIKYQIKNGIKYRTSLVENYKSLGTPKDLNQ